MEGRLCRGINNETVLEFTDGMLVVSGWDEKMSIFGVSS
jgi:hypothetical protein